MLDLCISYVYPHTPSVWGIPRLAGLSYLCPGTIRCTCLGLWVLREWPIPQGWWDSIHGSHVNLINPRVHWQPCHSGILRRLSLWWDLGWTLGCWACLHFCYFCFFIWANELPNIFPIKTFLIKLYIALLLFSSKNWYTSNSVISQNKFGWIFVLVPM